LNSTEPTPTESTLEATTRPAARLVREYVLGEVADFIQGAAFDGRRLVLAAGYRLFRIAPSSGRVVDEVETFPHRGGLAYDGRHVWQCTEDRIEQLDPRTWSVLKSLSPPLGEITGLGCIGHDLLLLHAGGRRLARVETLDATSVADVEVSAPLRGLAWVGLELWSSTAGSLCRIDPASGQVVAQLALPAGIEVCDLAADDEGNIWCVDGRSRLLRAFVI
jgi:hypothetical protein